MTAHWAPQRYWDKTLDDFQTASDRSIVALRTTRRFAAKEIDGLVLSGPTGTGKTHLAVAAAQGRYDVEYKAYRARLEKWQDANPPREFQTWNDSQDRLRSELALGNPATPEWCSVPELIVGLRSDMDRERSEREWSERLELFAKYSGIVVLDDLGREKVSDWTGEAIYVLLDGRYQRMLPTIVTTNLTGPELAASPYWPCISRIAEGGELVRVDGKDWRLAK